MKPITMRGYSTGIFFCIAGTLTVLFSGSVVALIILHTQPVPPEVRIIINTIAILFLMIPSFAGLISAVFSFSTKIEIYDSKIIYSAPLLKKKEMPIDSITVFGLVAYAARSEFLFFCTEEIESIYSFLDMHWAECLRIYGKDRCELLKCTDNGSLKLATGTYLLRHLFCPSEKVIILRYGTAKRLKEIVSSIGRDALLTGPWLVETEAGWKQFATFDRNEFK